jgi:magnesium transporter
MINPFKGKSDAPFEWVDVINPSNEELLALGERYNLHPSAIQDCMQPEHLPKYELIEEVHFIICRFYDDQADKQADSIQALTSKLAIFFTKDLLITIHRQDLPLLKEAMDKYRNHPSTLDVVCKAVKACFTSYQGPANKLDAEIDFYESRIFLKKRILDLLKSLYRIKRQVYVLRKLTNLTEEIVQKLSESSSRKNPYAQDLKDSYVKTDTQVEEVYDSILSLLNIYLSISSQRTNEVMRTLTVFTAFFLPLTFIVGVYGMNFQYMPELNKVWGYPGVIGLMLAITIVVWIWFKRKGWL